MDGCSWAGGGEKELRSDVKEEVVMKVKKEQWGHRAWFEKLCVVPRSLQPSGFLGCGVSRGEGFFFGNQCSSPASPSCGNISLLLATFSQVRTADASSERAIK